MNSFLLGDKGYLSSVFSHLLRDEYGVNLWTPQRRNMTPSCDPEADRVCFRIRRRIETVIGQLAERFHCQKIRARTLLSLTSRMGRKILAHTIGVFFCKQAGVSALQFNLIVP